MELVKGIVHVLTAPPPPPPPHHNYHPGVIYPHQSPLPHHGPPHHHPPPPHHGPPHHHPPHHGPPHHHPPYHHPPPGPPYHHGPRYRPPPPPEHVGPGWIQPYGPPGSSLIQPRTMESGPETTAPSAPSIVLHVHQANPPPYSETEPRFVYPKLG